MLLSSEMAACCATCHGHSCTRTRISKAPNTLTGSSRLSGVHTRPCFPVPSRSHNGAMHGQRNEEATRASPDRAEEEPPGAAEVHGQRNEEATRASPDRAEEEPPGAAEVPARDPNEEDPTRGRCHGGADAQSRGPIFFLTVIY
jgi:hypothetical protein